MQTLHLDESLGLSLTLPPFQPPSSTNCICLRTEGGPCRVRHLPSTTASRVTPRTPRAWRKATPPPPAFLGMLRQAGACGTGRAACTDSSPRQIGARWGWKVSGVQIEQHLVMSCTAPLRRCRRPLCPARCTQPAPERRPLAPICQPHRLRGGGDGCPLAVLPGSWEGGGRAQTGRGQSLFAFSAPPSPRRVAGRSACNPCSAWQEEEPEAAGFGLERVPGTPSRWGIPLHRCDRHPLSYTAGKYSARAQGSIRGVPNTSDGLNERRDRSSNVW